jgi:hypothetical protein
MKRRQIFILTIFLTWLPNLIVFGANTVADNKIKFDPEKQMLLNKLSQFYQYTDDTDEKVIGLIKRGQYDDFLGEAFIESFFYRSFDVVNAFIERGKEKDIDIMCSTKTQYGWTPLHYAAYAQNLAAVSYLLGLGMNANYETFKGGWSPNRLARYLDMGAHPFPTGDDTEIMANRKKNLRAILVALGDPNPDILVNKKSDKTGSITTISLTVPPEEDYFPDETWDSVQDPKEQDKKPKKKIDELSSKSMLRRS